MPGAFLPIHQVSAAFLGRQHFYFDETNMLPFDALWVFFITENPVKLHPSLKGIPMPDR